MPVRHLIHHIHHTSPVIPWEARGVTRTAEGGKEAKRGNRECQQEGQEWGEFDGVKNHLKAEGSGEEGARLYTLQCGRGSVKPGRPQLLLQMLLEFTQFLHYRVCPINNWES